jgi:hypothetical protein
LSASNFTNFNGRGFIVNACFGSLSIASIGGGFRGLGKDLLSFGL